jgi:hypothetical protein
MNHSEYPTRVLNGITFTLLGKFLLIKYKMVLFSVNTGKDTQKYSSYKSHSEGLWRFSYYKLSAMTDSSFKKGDDYITTTQMHMDLQCFFETNYETLPTLEPDYVAKYVIQKDIEEDPTRIDKITAMINSKNVYYPRNRSFPLRNSGNIIIPNERFRIERDYAHPVFNPLNALMRPGEGLLRLSTIFKNPLEKIDETIPNEYNPYFPLRRRPDELISSEIANYKTSGKNIRKSPRDFYFEKFHELLSEISNKETIVKPVNFKSSITTLHSNPPEQILSNIVKLYSEYMKFFFETGPEPSKQVCVIDLPVISSKTACKITVYKRIITFIKEKIPFELYYGIYTIPDEFPTIKGTYKIILNLVPYPFEVNEFGMNKHYISAGIYIYKPFDYARQMINREETYKISNYIFLGDIFTKMWPLEDVHEDSTTTSTSSARRTRRNSKKRRRQTIRRR